MKKTVKTIEFTWEQKTSVVVERHRSITGDVEFAAESGETTVPLHETATDEARPEYMEVSK